MNCTRVKDINKAGKTQPQYNRYGITQDSKGRIKKRDG
ncbi:hypothetical protein MTTB_05720 [Methanothermobacter tenebrarum]|uniref:Uncharacterized protein n=1 Tax=Methanothermobacter tenebrarum TaxID=680118 RepID=A0ABM7YCX0_9EURY|nr:hypothetical protein MTTB_05720 [Methanothermobacter tenebrarum]